MGDFWDEALSPMKKNESLTPTDEGDVFGPFTSNEFLNNTKVLNASNFFVFAPLTYMTYYWSIVRRNLEWYNGYVWGIHNKGVLSSQTGAKICKMAAGLTISGGYRFEGDERAESFLNIFSKTKNIEAKLKQKLPIHNAIGFTLAKLDVDEEGELDVTFVQGNRYFAETDNKKHVLAFCALEQIVSANVFENKEGTESEEGYYLVEERFFKSGYPCQRFRIYSGPIVATSPVYDGKGKGIAFDKLPTNVQRALKRYNGRTDKLYRLPFMGHLGAEIMLNSYSGTGMDDYACFSDSTLANVHASLYELDLTKTQKNEHKYIAQDFVGMPGAMMMKEFRGFDEARDIASSLASVEGFNKRLVKTVKSVDPSKQVPFIFQPELRTDAYNNDINQILNEIAAGAQFSPITLAGFLRNGTEKSATEITADENATRCTIVK